MKALVFLLVLANLLFYAYSGGYLGHPDNPDAGRVDQQVVPDKIHIVSRGEAPTGKPEKADKGAAKAEDKPVPPADNTAAVPPVAEAAPVEPAKSEAVPAETVKAEVAKPVEESTCLFWKNLPVADADRLGTTLTKRFAEVKLSRKVSIAESNGWWVYVPPLPSKADAEKKAGELRDLGVSDFFVVNEGATRFAISLGVFSSKKGGEDRLAELKGKGVRSAVLGPRPGKDDTVTLQARGPQSTRAAMIAAGGEVVPKNDAFACK